MIEFAAEELKKAAVEFYTVTNIKIVLYDENRKVLFSYPYDMCPVCTEVRTSPVLAKHCFNCDKIGFETCAETKKPYIYKCHMNLTEAIAPICENGILIGYMMIGQVLKDSDCRDAERKILESAEKYGLNTHNLLLALKNMRPVSDAFIQAAVSMMSMCASYLYFNKIIRNNPDILIYQIKNYIESHLKEDLSVPVLCRRFYLSKSKLYALSNAAFHMGISDYIRQLRITEAKKLLAETKNSITQIAEETGFKDANYFIRTFKKLENRTPGQFRKSIC